MKKRRIKIMILGLLLAGLCLGLILFSSQNKSESTKRKQIKIMTTTAIYSEIANKIIGNQGKAQPIVDNPNLDPHDFKPSTKTAENVAEADLVISTGLGYDDWVNPLIKNQKWLNIGQDVLQLKRGVNPHIWFDYYKMLKFIDKLAIELGQMKPEKAAYFKKNAKSYRNSLKILETKMSQIKKLKTNNLVDVSEPVLDYTLENLGFKVNNKAFAHAIESSADPSVKSAQEVINDFKNHKVAFYVENIQVVNNTTQNLKQAAKYYQIPILQVTEMKPKQLTYLNWQKQTYDQIIDILKK